MDRRTPLPQASTDSDESSNSEKDYETGDEQGFVRSDRKAQESASEEEEDDDDGDDAEEGMEEESAPEPKQRSPDEARSESDSDASSASQGTSLKPDNQFVVVSRKPDNGNGNGKKTAKAQKPLKQTPKAELSPKKGRIEVSKRDREGEAEEKGSSKKLKKEKAEKSSKAEHLPKPKDSEKAGKEKHTPAHTGDKESELKKAAHIAGAENPKSSSFQQHPSKRSENGSAKKASKAEKGKKDKKASKSPEPESKKEPFSPSKPKLWTPKDEIALSTEILHDIKLGIEVPVKKSDAFWSKLFGKLKGKMEGEWNKDQLCEKVKRMKTRYSTMAEKMRDLDKQFKFRNSTDQDLFGLWSQIWGNGGDAIKVDNDRERDEGKEKQAKPIVSASPIKASKLARDKLVSATTPVHKELGTHKGKQSEKQSSETDEPDSEESDDEADSQGKKLTMTPMEVDQKDAPANGVSTLVPKVSAVQVQGNNTPSHSRSDAQRLFQDEIRASLSELQECSKKTLKEWQIKAMAVVESAVKAAADQSRLMNGLGVGGLGGLSFAPFRSLDLMDLQPQGEHAFQQQWHELHLQELDVYRQRLELMQRECQLKQDQLKLQLHSSK